MTVAAGTKLGPYEITGAIGAGGMGEVYKAHDTKLGRDVAIKVLPEAFAHDPERLSRFQREAKILASLNHPNIATIYGLEQSNGTSYLVMELVSGDTLAERIKREGAVPIEEALGIAKQIAEALEAAHEKGIIHRDLKPANVNVTPEGKVKVLDFGLAKAFAGDVADSNLSESPTLSAIATMQGVILGTAAYMSPEQARSKSVDKRTDIWAFGCVLYELLTGRQAFEGEDITEILAAVVKTEPDWSRLPESTTPAIRMLLRRCLRKDKHQRFHDAADVRIEIEEAMTWIAEGGSQTATPAPIVERRKIRERVAWAVAAIAIVATLALAFVHFRETAPQQPSGRFEVLPPQKSTILELKLSPDGRHLAIVASEAGQTRLWVRPLDSLQALALSGTEDATFPFWSPDSAFIGFFAHGKLKKIAATGGSPQILCDATAGRGATWSTEGVILFAPNISGALYRVPAEGGNPAPVTKLAASGTAESHRFPEFLPGGSRFLYVSAAEQPETTGIYVGSLDGMQPVRILPDNAHAVYVPPTAPGSYGYLLFSRETTLMVLPFDANRLRAVGDMFPVAEQVGNLLITGNAAFSASTNGVLAYWTGNTLVRNRQLVWVDRTGKQISSITKSASILLSALSPDEKTIAMVRSSDNGFDIWLQDLGRGSISRFTFGLGFNRFPLWSPDGGRIVFESNLPSAIRYDFYEKPVSGAGKEELLLHAGINARPTDWSPDGKYIVYSEYTDKTNNDLWLLPLQGDHKPIPYLQSPFNEVAGQFSPDGRWMAYASDESGEYQVYVQAIPPAGAKWQISTAGGIFPRWRRDGKELFYVAPDQKVTAVPIKTAGSPSAPFEAGTPQPLFAIEPALNVNLFPYQPVADGQRFLVNAQASGEATAATPIIVVLNWTAGLKK
jgi:serine/threonine protein kinase/Tol biopolymer transport system component